MKSLLRLARPARSAFRSIDHQKSSHSTPFPQLCAVRSFHGSVTRLEAKSKDGDTENLSFRGQLYQSTAERLKRERSSEEQYIKATNVRRGAGESRTLALSFGEPCFSSITLLLY